MASSNSSIATWIALHFLIYTSQDAHAGLFDFIELFQSTGIDLETNITASDFDKSISKYSYSCSPNDYLVEKDTKDEIKSFFENFTKESIINTITSSGGTCDKRTRHLYTCSISKYRLRRISGDSSAKPHLIKFRYEIDIVDLGKSQLIRSFKYRCQS